MKISPPRVFVLPLSLAFLAAQAVAQAPPPVPEREIGPPPVRYDFHPPGARSLGMGASFVGLADDATASEANPAGLTILTKPEVSLHLRESNLDNEAPDTVTGRGTAIFQDRAAGVGFASVVYPWRKAVASLYYQRAADHRSHSFFEGVIGLPTGGDLANYDQVRTQFTVDNVGLSGAVKAGSQMSLGASVRLTRVGLDALQQATFPFSTPFGGAADFEGFLYRAYSHPSGRDTKVTWNAGLLFRPAGPVTLGAVYKKGASYRLEGQFIQDFVTAAGTTEWSRTPVAIPLRLPDVLGGGLALRPTESWTILADLVQVRYSQTDAGPDALSLYQVAGQGGREPLANGVELHLGMEYTWALGADWLLAARAGYFTDPDHDGLTGVGSQLNHLTLGGGVVVKNSLQLDVAADFGVAVERDFHLDESFGDRGRVRSLVVSMVTRF